MNKLYSKIFALTLMLTGSSCQEKASSDIDTVFGEAELVFVGPDNDAPISTKKALGALYYRLDDGDLSYNFSPHCTAFKISVDKIITAAHCIKNNGMNLFYRSSYFASSDAILQFTHTGIIKATSSESYEDITVQQVIHISNHQDIAVLKLIKDSLSCIRYSEDVFVHEKNAVLLSFPQGQPLAKSTNCTLTSKGYHDCDSLSGSSGGAILDQNYQLLGIHIKGYDTNDLKWYEKEQRFETQAEIVARICSFQSECIAELSPRSYNRALLLSDLDPTIKDHWQCLTKDK